MAEVKVGENESIESSIKTFQEKDSKSWYLSEVKNVKDMKNQAVKRKRKSEAARKRKV